MKKGDIVDRGIEGLWFGAIVESVDNKGKTLTLKYLDDGNIEDYVPFEDVRLKSSIEEDQPLTSRRDTLPKPLAGLVEDDSDYRFVHKPTVVMHNDSESENAIIINGAENKLAAGGGLRALRYLKH